MTNASKRALFKTALVIGIIAIILAIGTVWPPIIGYAVLAFVITVICGVIFMGFKIFEDEKESRSKWK